MGIYYNTMVCYGFHTKDEINVNELEKGSYCKFDNGTIIFVPHTLKSYGDFTLDKTDIAREFIKLKKVCKIYKIDESYFKINDEEAAKLNKLADIYNVDKSEIKIWVIESIWYTLEPDCLPQITNILPVISKKLTKK